MSCSLCPRHCADSLRLSAKGFCGAGTEVEVAAVCRHLGEEPPLVGRQGICNVFFAHCNLQCLFCQNGQIACSRPAGEMVRFRGVGAIADRIIDVMATTEPVVGFVSGSHYADSIPAIVDELRLRGKNPTVVYNTGGYDSVETLRRLEPYVDIYLPDFKYSNATLAGDLSHAPDYPVRAGEALVEMFRQKGSALRIDDEGLAFGGIVIRHLVLPGMVENSLRCLDWIAENLSTNLHLSIMSQYYPPDFFLASDYFKRHPQSPLARRVTQEEYDIVVEHFYSLGFHNGWIQELDSARSYRPDFSTDSPFM